MQVAFIAGVMYTCVGLLNLGWITNFISHTVIAGFMSGAAVIIGLSQACIFSAAYYICLYAFGSMCVFKSYCKLPAHPKTST